MIAMWSTHSKAPPLCSQQRGGCGHDDHTNDDDNYYIANYDNDNDDNNYQKIANHDNDDFCDPHLPHDIGWHDGVGASQIPFDPHTAVLGIIIINYQNYHHFRHHYHHYCHNCNSPNWLIITNYPNYHHHFRPHYHHYCHNCNYPNWLERGLITCFPRVETPGCTDKLQSTQDGSGPQNSQPSMAITLSSWQWWRWWCWSWWCCWWKWWKCSPRYNHFAGTLGPDIQPL